MVSLGKASMGISTFFASQHPTDQCGSNGLPLTPNSIVIFGRFQKLKTLVHRNICQYLDIQRSKHERLIVVQEHYHKNLLSLNEQNQEVSFQSIQKIAYEVLDSLVYLNEHGIVHRNLAPDNILLDVEGNVKLSRYGLYYMTGEGSDVSFPVGCPKYMSPEVVAAGVDIFPVHGHSGPKVDVWSLGMIILECLLETPLWPDVTEHGDVQEIFDRIFLLTRKHKETGDHPLNILLKEHNAEAKLQELSSDFKTFLKSCLTIQISERPSPQQLLYHTFFTSIRKPKCKLRNLFYEFPKTINCLELELPNYEEIYDSVSEEEDHLAERPLHEVYYMWTLAGGDVEAELKKQGLIKTRPPILSVSNLILESGEILGLERDRIMLLDETIITLSLQQLRKVLSRMKHSAYYPLIEEIDPCPYVVSEETANLPLVIREKDVEYQFHRIILFQRLLQGYPYTKDRIHKEAKIDIPPMVRPLVWASLLGVQGDIQRQYEEIDKESITSTDRQIEVDIPRCHQYDSLLSSPSAHKKLKRVLKAWIVSHPHLSYWQGLDSLCAAFLSLNFNNEALAYACLSAFIPKYLYNFFMKDNSPVIHEYLAVFSQLIAFHDPELFSHLDGIGFIPELYAIPWFLTMFAHVFPLQKIYHLWDTLLLGNSSLPLCFGVAILQQLRDQLLSFGFNECILLFSDMPEIDIQQCVLDSIKIFCTTPRTSSLRQNDSHSNILVNGQTKPEKEFVSIAQLKEEVSPRISSQDLIHICDLSQNNDKQGDGKAAVKNNINRRKKPKGLVIDVRTPEEFSRGCVSGSVNVPFSQAFTEGGELAPCAAVDVINSLRGRILIVVGNKGEQPHKFAEGLVKLKYPKVCVLECQVSNLRAFQGVVIVPET